MKRAYNSFYNTLSSKEQKILQESQKNWFNNIKHQSFVTRNSYETREFYLCEHIQERIDLLKESTKNKNKWTEYLNNRDKNALNKMRYLEKIKSDYSDICIEVENFLKNQPTKIEFVPFQFEKEDKDVLGNFERGGISSTLYFDIDNDGKKEKIERYSSIIAGTFSSNVEVWTSFYKTDDTSKGQRTVISSYGCGAVEIFKYKNKNNVFYIDDIIKNNDKISQYYNENNLKNDSMEYLKQACTEEIYEERNVCNPPYVTIIKYETNNKEEICFFALK